MLVEDAWAPPLLHTGEAERREREGGLLENLAGFVVTCFSSPWAAGPQHLSREQTGSAHEELVLKVIGTLSCDAV